MCLSFFFFFSSRRRHTRCSRDWSSDVCSSDLTRARRHSRGARPAGGGSKRSRRRSTRTHSTTGPERVAALAVGDAALGAQARGRAGGHRGRRDECGADGVDGARDAWRGPATAGDGVWARLSAECGVWNAESQGKVVRGTTPTLTFRIPNSALGFVRAPPLPPCPLLPAPLLLLRFLHRGAQAHPGASVRGRRARGTGGCIPR